MIAELELRELSVRIENVIQLFGNGGYVDHTLVKQLHELSTRCVQQYVNNEVVDPDDIKLLNEIISLIELNL